MKGLESLGALKLPTKLEQWKLLKNEILQTITSKETGLNTVRIKSYIESLGLQAKLIIFIDSSDIKQINKIFEKFGFHFVFNFDDVGRYFGDIGIGIINRGIIDEFGVPFEDSNDLILFESFAIHESSHGTDEHNCNLNTPYKTSSGFITVNSTTGNESGNFIEEGFAEYTRKQYLKNNSFFAKNTAAENTYAFLNSKKQFVGIHTSRAGYGLELLCRNSPELWLKILEARKTKRAESELISYMEEKWPGLYEKLYTLPNTEAGFIEGLAIIKKILK